MLLKETRGRYVQAVAGKRWMIDRITEGDKRSKSCYSMRFKGLTHHTNGSEHGGEGNRLRTKTEPTETMNQGEKKLGSRKP